MAKQVTQDDEEQRKTGHTRRRRTKENRSHKTTKNKGKHNTVYVGHHYAQPNTNNINKTWALLQTTGDKDEPKIVTYITTRIQNVKTHNRTTQKYKKDEQHGPHQLSYKQYNYITISYTIYHLTINKLLWKRKGLSHFKNTIIVQVYTWWVSTINCFYITTHYTLQ